VQFLTDIPPNQQGHEGADLGVIEVGGHPVQAFSDLTWVEPVGELSMNLVCDVLQVRMDLGWTWVGVGHCRTGHTFNLPRSTESPRAPPSQEAMVMHLTIRILNDRKRSAFPVRRDIQGSRAGAEEELHAGRIGLGPGRGRSTGGLHGS